MKHLWRLLLAVAILASMIPVTPVLATAQPDSVTIVSQEVFRNLLESGDQLYVSQYNISYAATPSEPVSDTFLFKLMDGATQLGIVTAYPYDNGGYGNGVVSWYFSAATVTALGMGWAQSYTVRIEGNPAYFASPSNWTATLVAADYSPDTSQSANQTRLGTAVIRLAGQLAAAWVVDLTTTTTLGAQLNTAGQLYFGSAIPNLVIMAPGIFPVRTISPTYPDPVAFTRPQQSTAYNRFSGTPFWDPFTQMQTDFGAPARLFSGIIIFIIAIACLWLSRRWIGDMRPGYFPAAFVIMVGAWWGWVAWPIMFIGALIIALVVGFDWFLSRA